MRIRTLTPLLAVVALACAGEAGDQAEATGETQEYAAETDAAAEADADAGAAIAAVSEAWETHYNMGHGSMVADFHAPDGMFVPAGAPPVEGREAIAEYLGGQIEAGSPSVSIDTEDTIVEGEWAVGYGSYSVEATPEGAEAVTNTGNWAALYHNVGGEWLIQGLMTNYDSADQPAPPVEAGAMAGMPEPPADLQIPAGLAELEQAYEQHFNLGHAGMVADLYAEDAVAMYAGTEPAEGRAAVEQALAGRIEAGASELDIQPLDFRTLSEDMITGHGIATFASGSASYAALYERGADGEWRIKWVITRANPSGGM